MDGEKNAVIECQCESYPDMHLKGMLPKPELWTTDVQRKTVSSMKVFTTIMLHAWRQRREEVRHLQKVVQTLHTRSMKTRNKLHVCDTLIRVEQKRNSELQLQLKQSTLDINQVRTSCESLASTVHDLTADKMQLQTNLHQREKEYAELEEISNQTKRELFGSLMQQRNLQHELCDRQRVAQKLQSENEQLISEVVIMEGKEAKTKKAQEWYQREMARKDELIRTMNGEIASLVEKPKS
ncbi:uncharacterized protein Dana_GF14797, isoform B [Drosophila ananassae]|uniref:Uncharacterized protein, isoform B n=1 Tax=Drosophila ananassae TaxID=7217 RepID=A0A0P9A3J1_DROAN|nr:uncharacterized protein LOC6497616 isoform X2 [Drosophila ananassae]KPU73127.1 uncharacterized protein Dana_GF14797, isoform B [Drosophila ananassae]